MDSSLSFGYLIGSLTTIPTVYRPDWRSWASTKFHNQSRMEQDRFDDSKSYVRMLCGCSILMPTLCSPYGPVRRELDSISGLLSHLATGMPGHGYHRRKSRSIVPYEPSQETTGLEDVVPFRTEVDIQPLTHDSLD
jgi:hypothetical protein